MMPKQIGIWISMGALVVTLMVNIITNAVKFGGMREQMRYMEIGSTKHESRLLAMEKQYTEVAVIKEALKNLDSKVNEIRDMLRAREHQ